MEEDISMPRNPVLAKFFRVVRLAENAGYGFDKMISGWKAYSGQPPEFDEGQDFTKVTFYLKSATQKTKQKVNTTRVGILNLLTEGRIKRAGGRKTGHWVVLEK